MWIAKRVLLICGNNNEVRDRLEINFSKPVENVDLHCFHTEIKLSGFIEEAHNIAGVDSVDSISLALSFVQRQLAHLSEAYTLRWDDGSPYEANTTT